MIYNADCMVTLMKLGWNQVDLIVTDPPYGMKFMGKDWDRAIPDLKIWKECLRVLKPGAFMFVMCAPRSDLQWRMSQRLEEAGFRVDFTPIYWTFATGFPKAGNIGKAVDKKMGKEREVVGKMKAPAKPASSEAKALDGSYGGFQPKPAVEVILVAMKPIEKKTYVEQALDNGKGITWLDDCRIPINKANECDNRIKTGINNISRGKHSPNGINIAPDGNNYPMFKINQGRFPANLLVSDDVLNDGKVRKGSGGNKKRGKSFFKQYSGIGGGHQEPINDTGSYSRFFSLDAWAEKTLPFLIVAKPSKAEKNRGLAVPVNRTKHGARPCDCNNINKSGNHHPTCKPIKLMSYLITMGSRERDLVCDPFMGSGTTGIAAKQLGRKFIGCEMNPEYFEIAEARINNENIQEEMYV